MRCLLAIFVLLMYLQPVQVQACASTAQQGSAHHHAAMAQHGGGDCCPEAPNAPMPDCSHALSCGLGAPGVSLLPTPPLVLSPPANVRPAVDETGQWSGAPLSPPFRPPIS